MGHGGYRRISTELWLRNRGDLQVIDLLLSLDWDHFRGTRKSGREYARISGISYKKVRRAVSQFDAWIASKEGRKEGANGAQDTPGIIEENGDQGRKEGAKRAHLLRDRRRKGGKRATTDPPEVLPAEEIEKLREWLREEGREWYEPRLLDAVGACLDHFRGLGEQRARWPATCRNWIRRRIEWLKPEEIGALKAVHKAQKRTEQISRALIALDKQAPPAASQGAARPRLKTGADL